MEKLDVTPGRVHRELLQTIQVPAFPLYYMIKNWLFTLLVLVGLSPVLHAQEGKVLNTYRARLSSKDHFSSSGERLTTPAAIIRQDRANFFKFNNADREDEGDSYFDTAEHRERLEQALEHGHTSRAAYKAIGNGTPLIEVTVYRAEGGVYIDVKIIEG